MFFVAVLIAFLAITDAFGRNQSYSPRAPPPPCSSSCSSNGLGPFLGTKSWQGKNHKRGANWCFGSKKNVIFSRRLHYTFPPIDDSHHLAILCRITTTSVNIDGGSVYSADQRASPISVIQLKDTPREKIFVMNSVKKGASLDLHVTFWTNGPKQNAFMNCQSYAGGDKDCAYLDDVFPQNANPAC